MSKQFLLPDLGEGLVEGEIVQWLVQVGDQLTLNQPLAEVETAKAIVELPSPFEGTVLQLHAEVGDTVAVGSPLVTVGVAGEQDEHDPSPSTASPTHQAADDEEAAAEQREPTLVGYGAPAASQAKPARRRRSGHHRSGVVAGGNDAGVSGAPVAGGGNAGAAGAASEPRSEASAAPREASASSTRPRSTPPVRLYAQRQGVNLEELSETLGGRVITRTDIDQHLAADKSATIAAASNAHGRSETRIPVRGVRKQTAAAMVQSAFSAPQVTVFHTIDVTKSLSLLAHLRATNRDTSTPVSLLALVSKAVCVGVRSVPEINASWHEATGEIVQYGHVDLGIAVATDRGLIVPHIHSAHSLTLEELAAEIKHLATEGRAGKTPLSRLTGGTISITNIGVFGVEAGSPLLPPGQSAILAVGAVRRQPWEHKGKVKLRDVLTLSLTIDHRVIDGAEASRYLNTVADLLERPERAMLYV